MSTENQDIRWKQRFSNYVKAFQKFEQGAEYIEHNYLDENREEVLEGLGHIIHDLLKQGLIQSFEFTHELAWNVMKDFANYQGNLKIRGSRDATREAFSTELLENGKVWMDMIESRNKTSHTYNEETSNEIFKKVLTDYRPAFKAFLEKMEEIRTDKQNNLFDRE